MLHGGCKRFLVLVAAGLEIVDHLEIDPPGDPVPIEVMDDDILFEDSLIVPAPCKEGNVVAAPGPEEFHGLGEADPV